jgi:hypothetical protein
MRALLIAAAATLAVSGAPRSAPAWGDIGHKSVCETAVHELDHEARAGVDGLVAADSQLADSGIASHPPRRRGGEHSLDAPRAVTTSQQIPSPPLFQLLPFSYPYPLIRVCRTDYGICLIPSSVRPGTPCSCLAANGAWLPGVCVH